MCYEAETLCLLKQTRRKEGAEGENPEINSEVTELSGGGLEDLHEEMVRLWCRLTEIED